MTQAEASPDSRAELSQVASRPKRKGCGCGTILLTAFLVLIVAPILALVVTFVWLRIADSYALERELDLAREAGYPLTLEELNASYPTSPEIEEATAHWQKAIEIVSSEAYQDEKVGVPIVYTEPNQYPPVEEPLPLTGERLAAARSFVERYAAVIEAAHAARRAGAVARFPVEFEKLIYEDSSHAQSLRDVVRLLQLDLEVRLADGDSEAATEKVLTIVAAADSLTNEPQVVTQLARIAFLGVASKGVSALLARADLTEAQLLRIQEAFASQRPMQGFGRAIQGERYAVQYLYRLESPIDDPRIETEGLPFFPDGDVAKSLAFFRRFEVAIEHEPAAAYEKLQPIFGEMEQIMTSSFGWLRSLNTALILPMVQAAADASARSDAECRLTEIALAIERYRLANAALPDTLEELVPAYLSAVPIDVFDGQALRYRIVEETAIEAGRGVSLYSVSRNRRDDEGLDDFFKGDIVLSLPDREVDRVDASAPTATP